MSCRWRLQGVANFYKERKNHIITTQTDHKCVLDSARYLQQRGFEVRPSEHLCMPAATCRRLSGPRCSSVMSGTGTYCLTFAHVPHLAGEVVAWLSDCAWCGGAQLPPNVTSFRGASVTHWDADDAQLTYLPVKPDGLIDMQQLRDAIRPETALVSIMLVNNEIGEPNRIKL